MNYLVLACLSFFLVGCTTNKDDDYYFKNPPALEAALKDCPAIHPEHISCEKLAQIAVTLNRMGRELQKNPQNYGRKILSLQETIASQKVQLSNALDKSALETSIKDNEEQLAQHLAIVKWLESPES